MGKAVRLGIAGLGTVGAELVAILQRQQQLIHQRAGTALEIAAISARSKSKDRGVDLSNYRWHDDPMDIATSDDVDIFVELIGGTDGPALNACLAALESGKHIVTANKAMLAIHGQKLAELAESNHRNINYEAAVAGGIPCIKALREGLAGNQITRVLGVMNGTCNYILTRMEEAGLSYRAAFDEADALGYLEADPNLDVGGIDAAHKLAILSALAFGNTVNFDAVELQGIDRISALDIKAAHEMGYRIKLLGVAQQSGDAISQTMQPCLVPMNTPLAQLSGGTNMVIMEGDSVGQIAMRGAGAGAGPTASAVLGDIIDITKGFVQPVFGVPASDLQNRDSLPVEQDAPYYLRLSLQDKAGVMAKITHAIADHGISIDRMRQKSHQDDSAPVIILTHPTSASSIAQAMASINNTQLCADAPVSLRIEQL